MDDLTDYCATCARRPGCSRLDTFTVPHAVHWPGPGQGITAEYECVEGHVWTCHWDAQRWFDQDTDAA